jgi:hypothetical protein
VDRHHTNPLLEDAAPPAEPVLARLKRLTRGPTLVLVAGTLLLFDLFLTWQNLEVDFGPAGTATSMLDGWDVWGLLIAFTIVALVTLVVVVYASDVDISDDVRWELWILVGAVGLFAMTLAKNLGDADSAWPSYLGLALAAAVVVGAYLDWAPTRATRRRSRQRRRLRRRTRSSPGPS